MSSRFKEWKTVKLNTDISSPGQWEQVIAYNLERIANALEKIAK